MSLLFFVSLVYVDPTAYIEVMKFTKREKSGLTWGLNKRGVVLSKPITKEFY